EPDGMIGRQRLVDGVDDLDVVIDLPRVVEVALEFIRERDGEDPVVDSDHVLRHLPMPREEVDHYDLLGHVGAGVQGFHHLVEGAVIEEPAVPVEVVVDLDHGETRGSASLATTWSGVMTRLSKTSTAPVETFVAVRKSF